MRMLIFFDKLEDKTRGWLSHHPILYAVTTGIGVILFWRGVWHTADFMSATWLAWQGGLSTTDVAQLLDGLGSLTIGFIILLVTGLFVSSFIGNEIIISGLRGEKKLTEKTEAEVKTETGAIGAIRNDVRRISKRLDDIEKKL